MRIRSAAPAAFAAACLALAPAHAFAGTHRDARLGYKIRTPADWTQIPLKIDEEWIAASFLGDKWDFWTDPATGWTDEHKPSLQVVAFVDAVVKDKGIVVEESADGKSTVIRIKNPYKDYPDFMNKTYFGGGWHIAEETASEVNGVPVKCLDIRVERMSYAGPKRIVTWIFGAPDVDLAVQFECLEGEWAKYEKEFLRCLRSFELIPRSAGSLVPEAAPRVFTRKEWLAMSVEERAKWRRSLQETAHAKALASVPEGWKAEKLGRFLVISHTDEKFVQHVVEQAGAVLDWLDEAFAFVGPGEYVREPILRICKDADEEAAFHKQSFSWNDIEIVCHQDFGGVESWQAGWVNKRAAQLWFTDRDFDLWLAMPWWLRMGLDEVLGRLRVQRRKVDFRADHWDRDQMREWGREEKLAPPADLMRMSAETYFGDLWQRITEASCLVHFFVSGEAKKSKTTQGVLESYVKNLRAVMSEIEASGRDDADVARPQTEEEEDRWFKERQASWKQKERRLLDETWERTFQEWSAKDWKRFDEAYSKAWK